LDHAAHDTNPLAGRCDIVGRGRMGQALSVALTRSGLNVRGQLGRGSNGDGASIVLLCVPDREIEAAAKLIAPGRMVGHVSASAPLALLEPHARFVMHPLLSVVSTDARFTGA